MWYSGVTAWEARYGAYVESFALIRIEEQRYYLLAYGNHYYPSHAALLAIIPPE